MYKYTFLGGAQDGRIITSNNKFSSMYIFGDYAPCDVLQKFETAKYIKTNRIIDDAEVFQYVGRYFHGDK